jgi:S1-C subfamily serine protease
LPGRLPDILTHLSLDRMPYSSHVPQVFDKRLIVALLLTLTSVVFGADPERSVVQIMNFSQKPAWDAPWRFDPVQRSSGSGFVIKGKRIMTNAHVISWARQIIVQRYQDPRNYLAEVEYVGHDCDLALLTVKDERFFEGLEPLSFGELPKVRSTVVTYGYPAGGEEISYTRGVVSRVQLEGYAHIGNRQLLGVQTDAAINPGNSGGPVIQEDRVVGVAFQGIAGLENTGFFIPPPVIDHFLKDIEDKKYDGFPLAGVRVVPIENDAYRKHLKLPDNDLGMRVDGFAPESQAEQVLKKEDVILNIAGFPVASDGSILYQGNRVSAALAFQFPQSGESVTLKVWRDGKEIELQLPVFVYTRDRTSGYQFDTLPRYFIYGGLVFTPLSYDFLRTLGNNPAEPNNDLIYELYYRRYETPEKARREPILLASVLADEANANVTTRGRLLVDTINGVKINQLEDVISAFENNTNRFDTIQFMPSELMESLDRKEVADSKTRIQQTHGIPVDRHL